MEHAVSRVPLARRTIRGTLQKIPPKPKTWTAEERSVRGRGEGLMPSYSETRKALEKLRRAREGVEKRIDQHHAVVEDIYEEVSEERYQQMQEERKRKGSFVVDGELQPQSNQPAAAPHTHSSNTYTYTHKQTKLESTRMMARITGTRSFTSQTSQNDRPRRRAQQQAKQRKRRRQQRRQASWRHFSAVCDSDRTPSCTQTPHTSHARAQARGRTRQRR